MSNHNWLIFSLTSGLPDALSLFAVHFSSDCPIILLFSPSVFYFWDQGFSAKAHWFPTVSRSPWLNPSLSLSREQAWWTIMDGLFFSVNPTVIAALMTERYIRREKNCLTTLELFFFGMFHLVIFCSKSLWLQNDFIYSTESVLLSEQQKSDSYLCSLFYVSHAALLFSNHIY